MDRCRRFAILASLLCCLPAFGRPPDTLWTRHYNYGVASDQFASVIRMTSGDLVFAGWTYNLSSAENILLMRMSPAGDSVWSNLYGGALSDIGRSVIQTTDGGFLIAGSTVVTGITGDGYFIKTDSFGTAQWTRRYGGNDNDWVADVKAVPSGGYIAAGYLGTGHVWVLRLNSNGDTLWTRSIGTNGSAAAVGVTADGGFIVGAYQNSGNAQLALIKLDSNGQTLWTKLFGGASSEYPSSVQQTSDFGYIIGGITYSYSPNTTADMHLVKTDSLGNLQWQRIIGGPGNYDDYLGKAMQTADGGFLMAGTFGVGSGTDSDGEVIKLNLYGGDQWMKTIDVFGGYEALYCAVQVAYDSFVVGGSTNFYCGNCSEEDFAVLLAPTPQGSGEDCSTPKIINSLPFTQSDSTISHNDDYFEACPWSDGGAPDMCYRYTPNINEEITISLCNSDYDTKVYVYENSYTNPFAFACNDDACSDPQGHPYRSRIDCLPITGGNDYFIIVDGFWADSGHYELQVSTCSGCLVSCPPSAIPEPEPMCIPYFHDVDNYGCDFTSPAFTPISCGDIVCGTTGTFLPPIGSDGKDHDWYKLTLSQPCSIQVVAQCEAPIRVGIWDGQCDWTQMHLPIVITEATGSRCDTFRIASVAAGGDYYIQIEPLYSPGPPCGTVYWFAVNCTCVSPPPFPPNDDCGNCQPVTVLPGSSAIFLGDNTNATRDCPRNDFADVWYCVTVPQPMDLVVKQCGTTPNWRSATEWMYDQCPCANTPLQMTFKARLCPDENYQIYFTDLPAGNYYYPVKDGDHMRGPFTLEFTGDVFQMQNCGTADTCSPDLRAGPNNTFWTDAEWSPYSPYIYWALDTPGASFTQLIARINPQTCSVDTFSWPSPGNGACQLVAYDPRNGGNLWLGVLETLTSPGGIVRLDSSHTTTFGIGVLGLDTMKYTGGCFDAQYNHLWIFVDNIEPAGHRSKAYELDVSNPMLPVMIQGPLDVPLPVNTRPILVTGGADYIDSDDEIMIVGRGYVDDYVICLRDVQPGYSGPPPGPGLQLVDWCMPDTASQQGLFGVAVMETGVTGIPEMYLTDGYMGSSPHSLRRYPAPCLTAGPPAPLVVVTVQGPAVQLAWSTSGARSQRESIQYRVYRGLTSDFPATNDYLIATTTDTFYVDMEALLTPENRHFYVVKKEVLP